MCVQYGNPELNSIISELMTQGPHTEETSFIIATHQSNEKMFSYISLNVVRRRGSIYVVLVAAK